MSVHRNVITNYSQQDATFLEFISSDALRVSGGSSARHQGHITVHTVDKMEWSSILSTVAASSSIG